MGCQSLDSEDQHHLRKHFYWVNLLNCDRLAHQLWITLARIFDQYTGLTLNRQNVQSIGLSAKF